MSREERAKEHLLQELRCSVGNKVYMRDIEALLSTVELTPQQAEALSFLARDIRDLKSRSNKKGGIPFMGL